MSWNRFTEPRAHLRAIRRHGPLLAVALSLLPADAGAHDSGLAFDFTIALSEKAAETLGAAHETITVLASYYGTPTQEGEAHANELGMVDLDTETFELPGQPGVAHVTGKNVKGADLSWIKGRPSVNVNLFTSRKSSDLNLIDCDLIDGEVTKVQAKPITVNCFLIGEPLESKTFP